MGEEVGKTLADLLQVKRCIWCQMTFTDMDEIGRLHCRVHPGMLQGQGAFVPGTDDNTYSCCGASRDPWHRAYRGRDAAQGCVPCDHTARRGKAPLLAIPLEQARVLFGNKFLQDTSRPGVFIDDDAGTVFIARYGDEPTRAK